jgi:hypothetical protein
VTLDTVDAPALAAAIGDLLQRPHERDALAAAARARTFKTWDRYAHDVETWMRGLRRRR